MEKPGLGMRRGRREWLAALGAIAVLPACAHRPGETKMRRRELVQDGDVRLDVIVEGIGPTLVLLPSLDRSSHNPGG